MASKADGSIIINTKIDTDGIDKGMNSAKSSFLGFKDAVKASSLGTLIAGMVKEIVKTIAQIAPAFIEASAAVKAENSQFEQTFKELEGTARNAISGVAQESGILETRLNQLGSNIYAFARSSGGSTEEAMALMEQSLRVAADSAAYYDRSLEDTTESLQSFLKGKIIAA